MQIAELTTDELKDFIRETVTQVLAEILDAPDEGVVFRSLVEQQILRSRQRHQSELSDVTGEDTDLNVFSGVIHLEGDPLEMQLQARNEWG